MDKTIYDILKKVNGKLDSKNNEIYYFAKERVNSKDFLNKLEKIKLKSKNPEYEN